MSDKDTTCGEDTGEGIGIGNRYITLLILLIGTGAVILAFAINSIAVREGHAPLRGLSPQQFRTISAENSRLPERFTNISFGGIACDSLASAGISADYSIPSKYEEMHIYSRHVLQFPPPRSNYYVDVPAKSGNHNWKGLFYRL